MRKKHITWQLLSTAIISLLMFSTPALAGSLNPSAPPGPTMKTLDQAPAKDEVIPPWSQILPANDTGDPCNSARFKCVMGGDAVLDKETGLVWDRTPGVFTKSWNMISGRWWEDDYATGQCLGINRSGRRGWRVPTIHELLSLVDPFVSSPALPSGHPFSFVQSSTYWSATTSADNNTNAWLVDFGFYGHRSYGNKSEFHYVWCVRGGSGIDVQ
ncbi:MAG: DUF1566 domain-containing protein [Nitrospirota bacterium]|nr:DUF1566 domain-containing protein [Nitrospirota bacterium]